MEGRRGRITPALLQKISEQLGGKLDESLDTNLTAFEKDG